MSVNNTRVGVAHRSAMRHSLHGDAKFKGVPAPLAGVFVDTGTETDLTFPAMTSISVHHQVNSKWAVMSRRRVGAGFPNCGLSLTRACRTR